jgi:(R,R)-butanediol dehydrogenase/meso-butanediol dehydrogenase/diacetyl reductase
MKALRWYAKKDLRYKDIPEPIAGPGQIKARINLAGICGSDLREFTNGPRIIDINKVPLTIGHEFAGTVVDIGSGVSDIKIGDRVTGLCYWVCGECYYCKKAKYNLCINKGLIGANADGCMAEYLVAPRYLFQILPDSVSDEIGSLVEPLSVGMRAVCQGKVGLGDTVVIVGDGPIGICTMLAAKVAGASKVYLMSKHKNRGAVALTMGATNVINVKNEDPIGIISHLTGGLGVDVSIDCVGSPDSPQLSLDVVRKGGTIVMVGASYNASPIFFRNLMAGEKTIIGSNTYINESSMAIALLADKRMDLSLLITSKIPIQDAVEKGFNRLLDNKEDNLKILLQIPQ